MTGRPDAYIPLYIGDYLADTTHLSTLEHGAYLLLLFHYWSKGSVSKGGGLPDNDRTLAIIAGVDQKQWNCISETIRGFFSPILVNGKPMLMQKRMEEVLGHVVTKYEKKMAAIEAANAAKKAAAERVALARADADADAARNEPQQHLKTKTKSSNEEESILSERGSDDLVPIPPRKRKRFAYPSDFEEFWRAYPTTKIMSKVDAAKEWAGLVDEDKTLALQSLTGFRDYCKLNPNYQVLHACRYLSGRRFDGFKGNGIDPALAEIQQDRADKILKRGRYAEPMP